MAETYLPAEIAQIYPDHISEGFWESCARRVLSIQQCASCGTFRHLPRPTCPNCHSFDYRYTPVSGRGTVYSYTVAHHPVHPALASRVPYNVVVVELEEAPVKLVSNLVSDETPVIGMPVEVVFEEPAPGVVLPRFRPAAAR